MNWYPLKLTAHVRAYDFGDRLIPNLLGKTDVPEGKVSETWEISDYRDTTGVITNGELAGQSLHDLTRRYPDELVGQGWRGPAFPILEKFIDASFMLPVHLHPDDEQARRLYDEPNGKTEAWHILWAAPNASVLVGVKPHLSRDDLFAAFKDQNYDAVMYRYPIQTGDTVYVPGGALHSFGPDTLIHEVEQTSDLTQTVMPTDLYGNRLEVTTWVANIETTLDLLRAQYHPRPNPGLERRGGENRYIVGCAGPYFALEHWMLVEAHTERVPARRCLTLSSIGDPVHLEYAAGTEVLGRGESCILPAAIGDVKIVPQDAAALIVCYIPDIARDIVEPLRAAGYTDEQIGALGDVTALTPVPSP